jgi:LPS-assembly protein
MNKKKNFINLIIIIVSVFQVLGQSSAKISTPVLKADDQIMQEDRIIARGNVEIAFDEYRIYADYMEYNQKTNVIIAQGRVTMTSNETVLTGERLEFNLKDRKGNLFDAYGQMPPYVRYKSDQLTQTDNETLTFKNIDFTSCNQCSPRWKITCKKGKIKKEKYVEMRHAVIKIKKIPILYIPYLRYPLNSDGRATGFLFPGLGTSSLRGFFMLNSFFWAISKNVDLTLNFDYYGKAGIGAAEELRYLFPNMEGNIKFYYFKYKNAAIIPEGTQAPTDQFYSYNTSDYLLKMTHKQKIDFLNTNVIVNIDKQSDANFLRLFSNDFDAVLRRTSRSSISINSSIGNVKLSLAASQNDTYFTFNNSTRTLRYLPKINVNWNQQKIWKIPGYFSLKASYSGVQRIGKSFDIDEGELFITDFRTQRLTLNPIYSLSLVKAQWLSAKLTFDSRHSFYPKSKDLETNEIVKESLHLGFNTAKLEFKGPVFSNIYEFKNSKIKHLIEPEIIVRYVTEVDDEDRARLLPVDYFDYPSYSYVGFKLSNRWLLKSNDSKSAKEIVSLSLSQDYYFDSALANRNRKVNGIYPEFSELKSTLRIRPFKNFSFDTQLVFNHFIAHENFIDQFTRIRFNVSYNNRKSFLWGNFNYSRFVNPYASSTYIFNRDTVGGALNFDMPRFPLKLNAIINYDITEKEFRNANIKVTYDYQCLQFKTELRLFRYGGRVESQFNFGVSFGNLGQVKDFLGIDK